MIWRSIRLSELCERKRKIFKKKAANFIILIKTINSQIQEKYTERKLYETKCHNEIAKNQ